jgi:protein involved in polysaccharide export with SLBB domain
MMLASTDVPNVSAKAARYENAAIRLASFLVACLTIASTPLRAGGQTPTGLLSSRDELTVAAAQAEQSGNSSRATAIRQRLKDGDFRVGDRIVFIMTSDIPHKDTLVVHTGLLVELPGKAVLPLAGVLRSELREKVTAEVLKYVKAVDIEVIPLTRIGVLGEVLRPGFFALRSDLPITEAIMVAGGPTPSADIDRTFVKRASQAYRSAEETRQAVRNGLTLDQFGFTPGDELVIGRQPSIISPYINAFVGLTASVVGIWFLLHAGRAGGR